MSRNLGDTSCRICRGEVKLDGEPHPITEAECGYYFAEYQEKQLVVANAHCTECDAKYLAWISMRCGGHFANREGRPFVDLSFRASFNDEPAPEDLPTSYKLQFIHRRNCLAHACDLRGEAIATAARLNAEATAAEVEADRPSYWESYRR